MFQNNTSVFFIGPFKTPEVSFEIKIRNYAISLIKGKEKYTRKYIQVSKKLRNKLKIKSQNTIKKHFYGSRFTQLFVNVFM